MPTYAYHCDDCDLGFERLLPIRQYDDPQDCPDCGKGPANKVVTMTNFILKGDGWAGKNSRIKGQMARKNARLKSKETDYKNDARIALAPNVDGERTGSWSDASKLAKSKGKDTSGYDKLARKEKK